MSAVHAGALWRLKKAHRLTMRIVSKGGDDVTVRLVTDDQGRPVTDQPTPTGRGMMRDPFPMRLGYLLTHYEPVP